MYTLHNVEKCLTPITDTTSYIASPAFNFLCHYRQNGVGCRSWRNGRISWYRAAMPSGGMAPGALRRGWSVSLAPVRYLTTQGERACDQDTLKLNTLSEIALHVNTLSFQRSY